MLNGITMEIKYDREKHFHDFYDKHLNYFDRNKWLNCSLTKEQFDTIISKLKLNSGQLEVLELGCGSGESAVYMEKKYGWKVLGIDYSHERVKMAQELAKKNNTLRCNFVTEDLNIILDNMYREFDLIIGFDVFEHLVHPEEIIEKSKQWLKPGGIICGTIPIEPNGNGEGRHITQFHNKKELMKKLNVECPDGLQLPRTRGNQATIYYKKEIK